MNLLQESHLVHRQLPGALDMAHFSGSVSVRGHVHMMSAQGGGTPKADAARKLIKGGCVKMQIKDGGGE